MRFEAIECDNCHTEAKVKDAQGWFALMTMIHASTKADLERPAPPEIGGTFCTLSCLVDFVEKKREAMMDDTKPVEPLGEYLERRMKGIMEGTDGDPT